MAKKHIQKEVTEKELDQLINYLQNAIIEQKYGNEVIIDLRGEINGNKPGNPKKTAKAT